MDRLQHIRTLKDMLWNQGLLLKHCRNLTRHFTLDASAIDDMPHAMLFGNSQLVTRMIARKHVFTIKNITQPYDELKYVEVIYESTTVSKLAASYKSYNDFIEIDVDGMDKMILGEVMKSIVQQKTVTGQRHVMIIYGVDGLNENMISSMRKLLEIYASNAYIIMTTSSMSRIHEAIKSRCIVINCNIGGRGIYQMTKAFVKVVRPDICNKEHILNIVKQCDNDILNVCVLLELANPHLYKGHLVCFVNKRIDELVEVKQIDIGEYERLLREICTKLSAACIPINALAKLIIHENRHNPKICDIVQLCADTDHVAMASNKTIFVMEKFIDDIVGILC